VIDILIHFADLTDEVSRNEDLVVDGSNVIVSTLPD